MNKNEPVDVCTSNVTPTTKQEIQLVDSTQWKTMSIAALHDQLYALQNRLYTAYEMKNISMATQIQRGIDAIGQIITEKMSPRRNDDNNN